MGGGKINQTTKGTVGFGVCVGERKRPKATQLQRKKELVVEKCRTRGNRQKWGGCWDFQSWRAGAIRSKRRNMDKIVRNRRPSRGR